VSEPLAKVHSTTCDGGKRHCRARDVSRRANTLTNGNGKHPAALGLHNGAITICNQ
jgi:hypothetical protein